jgi:hypothetical protein
MKYTPEELQKAIFELETARGISRADHPSLQALPAKRWLFVMLWCDSEVIIRNKTQWAKEHGFHRTEIPQYLGDKRVIEAINYLGTTSNQAYTFQLTKVVYEQAMKGDYRAQKLWIDTFPPKNIVSEDDLKEDPLTWDTSLSSKSKPTQDKPSPQDHPETPN